LTRVERSSQQTIEVGATVDCRKTRRRAPPREAQSWARAPISWSKCRRRVFPRRASVCRDDCSMREIKSAWRRTLPTTRRSGAGVARKTNTSSLDGRDPTNCGPQVLIAAISFTVIRTDRMVEDDAEQERLTADL